MNDEKFEYDKDKDNALERAQEETEAQAFLDAAQNDAVDNYADGVDYAYINEPFEDAEILVGAKLAAEEKTETLASETKEPEAETPLADLQPESGDADSQPETVLQEPEDAFAESPAEPLSEDAIPEASSSDGVDFPLENGGIIVSVPEKGKQKKEKRRKKSEENGQNEPVSGKKKHKKDKKTGENTPETIVNAEENADERAARKQKKTMDKKKKLITVITVIAAVAVILAISITVPIVIVNKGKIFVAEAEDFNNVEKGDIFVLSKDVVVEGDLTLAKPFSIDLNKHTLTVKGNLVYDFVDAVEGTQINLGSRKGKEWIASGVLDVQGDIKITAPKASVGFYGAINASNYAINAAKFESFNSFRAASDAAVTAGEMIFNDKIVFTEVGNVYLANGTAVMKASVNAVISLENTKLSATREAELNTVKLDAGSVFDTQGKVTGKVTNRLENERGKEVYFEKGSSCPLVENIETVRIYVADSDVPVVENYGSIIYMEKLNTPLNVNIVDKDGRLLCVVSKVQNAAFYEFTVDGEVYTTSEEPTVDVTEAVSKAGSHSISVIAKGADGDRFIASEPVQTTYNYEVKLATPTNISVEQTSEGKVFLRFPSVNFAEEYDVTVNGVTEAFKKDGAADQRFDITHLTAGVGEYSVNIVAKSYNTVGFKNSNAGAYSFIIDGKLGAPAAIGSMNETNFTVSWNAVANAKYYTVYRKVGDELAVVKTITGTSVSFDRSTLEAGAEFYVKAEGSGFYAASDLSAVAIYTPETQV